MAQAPGVVLPAGAQAVHTASVRAVAEAVGQAMAAEGAACVFGDAGRGKTVALRMALSDPPVGWSVSWVRVPVRPSVSELRRAVFEALTLAGRFPHRSAEADERIIGALGQARVLVVLPVAYMSSPERACASDRSPALQPNSPANDSSLVTTTPLALELEPSLVGAPPAPSRAWG